MHKKAIEAVKKCCAEITSVLAKTKKLREKIQGQAKIKPRVTELVDEMVTLSLACKDRYVLCC